MNNLRNHLSFVSRRHGDYKFEHVGGLPDRLDENGRQLYMDSFIVFALPIELETVGKARLECLTERLNYCMRARIQWIPSEMLSILVDEVMWLLAKYVPSYESAPPFPWEIPEWESCSKSPSFIYKAWRKQMKLPCGYPKKEDDASTDLMLSDALRLSTPATMRAFLEEQHLWQWYNTRATIPRVLSQHGQTGTSEAWQIYHASLQHILKKPQTQFRRYTSRKARSRYWRQEVEDTQRKAQKRGRLIHAVFPK
ncbi:unnamed protein product [Clonostachys rosea]|uniref:Uncharacterized protein n=1 Tax=Bionectria ochroleuca TaxID=29856 RepID=A0ABY6U039_BIOOC|nr:unnamed protein product [Clonostachys rosea]